MRLLRPIVAALLALLLTGGPLLAADALEFDDFPLQEPLSHPKWFKQSFLDLQEDLQAARDGGKSGIVVYFGQRRCAYCKQLMEVNFGLEDIVDYTRRHFDLIAVDIWGIEELTDLQGVTLSEREFAVRENTNFTPSLIFYNTDGEEALRLRGYYPPYKFRAALEYVADGHYRTESFAAYLERGSGAMAFEPEELNEEPFFSPPPYALDRSIFPGERPLAVFFEQGDCHACNVLHSKPLGENAIQNLLQQFDSVQLNAHETTPVITPDGRRTSARRWARELGLFYYPSILFFDTQGREIMRIDSVVQFYRLRNLLNYIASGGYRSQPSYQRWRVESRL